MNVVAIIFSYVVGAEGVPAQPLLLTSELMTTCSIAEGEATAYLHNLTDQTVRLEPEARVVYFGADSKIKKIAERGLGSPEAEGKSSHRLFSTKNIPKEAVSCAVVPRVAR